MGSNKFFSRVLFCILMWVPMHLFAVGWTPTDAGQVVNMEQGEHFLLSVWVDKNGNGTEEPGEEFFVSNYNRYSGGYYDYSDGSFMKLLPATEVTEMNEWTVGAPLARGNKALGGIAYTIWNDGKTLKSKKNEGYKFLGELTGDYNDAYTCDVVFVIPTNRGVPDVTRSPGPNPTSFDPDNTLKKGTAPFDGATGTGFLGMTYREVFMFEIPKANSPQSYTNAALVTFNTTLSTWKLTSGAGDIAKGKAAYAYADKKHDKTPRTLFRLYILNNPFVSCPNTYFFATDEQDYINYRKTEDRLPGSQTAADSTAKRKTYTMDYLTRMDRVEETSIYKTGWMRVPTNDSTYFYVGKYNTYVTDATNKATIKLNGAGTAVSQFTNIGTLRIDALKDATWGAENDSFFIAPTNALGRMVVDTTTSTVENLGVAFEPCGYMLKVSTGTNVRMKQDPSNPNIWISEEMWTITEAWSALSIKATLMTDSVFSETDPGCDIEGWSKFVVGTSVPVVGGGSVINQSGYARITTTDSDPNGDLEFVLVNKGKRIHYDNNRLLGVQIPDQYPLGDATTLRIEQHRLKAGYTFDGWTTNPDGTGTKYQAGDVVDLASLLPETKDSVLNLYAQAHYNGTLQVAISFIGEDGKRYFLTHPGSATPRYARARHFEDWENTWQGMEDAANLDPNYVSTFEMRHPNNKLKAWGAGIPADTKLDTTEMVLDPRRYTMRGYVDSLTFYENFQPSKDEYLGLYYTNPNVILANNTWAGLFKTTSTATVTGWPDYQTSSIDSVKLMSTRYVEEEDPENHPDSLTLKLRSNRDKPYVWYNATADEFDGVATVDKATYFQISAVAPADAHYIIVPDTTETWRDTVTFDMHHNEQIREELWTSLIGKQLMAVMMVGKDTVFFHPNRNKIINDPNELYLSKDFRVSQFYEFIPDARVTTVAEEDRVTFETTDYHWHNTIVSGANSPMDVTDGAGNYIDIIDTIRIALSHGGISQIKEYRGRWNANNPKVTASPDGSSRTRNVIIRTKTYHYGADEVKYILTPAQQNYSFNPFKDQSQQINFTLTKLTTHDLLDVDNNPIRTDTVSAEDVTDELAMVYTVCSFKESDRYFHIDAAGTKMDHVTVLTNDTNRTAGENMDTLVISGLQVEIDGINYPVETARVPLSQTSLVADELLWSVVHNGQRYFIMAIGSGDSDSLQFRQFTQSGSSIYQYGSKIALEKGSNSGDNTSGKYITPWTYSYNPENASQLSLKTEYGIDRYFNIPTDAIGATAGIHRTDSSFLTYHYVNVYTNDNTNQEELVKLQFGPDLWLQFDGSALKLVGSEEDASIFSWTYMVHEFNLQNNGTYPSHERVEFGYNATPKVTINTKYKAYSEYSVLLNNKLTYFGRTESTHYTGYLENAPWLTTCTIDTIRDHRTATLSGFTVSVDRNNMTTSVTPTGFSPTEVKDAGGNYIDIVDTLRVRLSLKEDAPAYRFKDKWSGFSSISDGDLKIPLVRKTYHEVSFDTVFCSVSNDEVNVSFPAVLIKDGVGKNDTLLYVLNTMRKTGTRLQDVEGNQVTETSSSYSNVTHDIKNKSGNDSIIGMHLNDKALAEVRLMDEYGNTPSWCKIKSKGDNTLVLQCLENGVYAPRTAYLYFAYIVTTEGKMRFVSYRITVSQDSHFSNASLQQLVHSNGASGDEMANGMQQVHENKRILYYYPEQDTELPIRERAFYGWWRWYRMGNDVNGADVTDSDVPDSLWRKAPQNTGGTKYNYPFHTIVLDTVWNNKEDHSEGFTLRTQGRYTVFHYKSGKSYTKADPPSKNPRVAPPVTDFIADEEITYPTLTYVADISNYYDHLPLSLSDKNQVDTASLDTMSRITEPTLSLREIFELHPWTEMADTLEHYKTHTTVNDEYPLANERYMEDHVVMAPLHTRLLLQTEQRYNLDNVTGKGHSESLLGYYMHDDNWNNPAKAWDKIRRDSMIYCGGWDIDCKWYTYNPATKKYTPCNHTVTADDDFLQVPAKSNIDTVYYCLRARSWKTETAGTELDPDGDPAPGDYWFNICRYKICYHHPNIYGPKTETVSKKETRALITNDDIEQRYEVLERLNFDYIQPGSSYHIYPHPLPWADASYGYTYPETSSLPHNRYHNESDFPNHGEYGLINRIPYATYWYKMEQHGGAANGYMIYCDGMSSAGQVAALSLQTHLCAGQKMFFSAYVGNPSTQTDKANPNFIFSVQGRVDDRSEWEDITTYMTGDIQPSDKWYQIYFPIVHNRGSGESGDEYTNFRVRIYNVSSNWDGNDFIIDDMCIFATKPPLIAYQANTACKEEGDDQETHVILRIDYQGISGESYNGHDVKYTVRQIDSNGDTTFVALKDHYLNETTYSGEDKKIPSIYGQLHIPLRDYEPQNDDSIFVNMNELMDRFEESYKAQKEHEEDPSKPDIKVFREGYIYEVLEGESRPVKYIIHSANMNPEDTFTVHISLRADELLNSICGMTSHLKVSNRMVLELNGMEEPHTELVGLCANETYDISLRVKGSLYLDSVAPIDLNGSCVNDWLLYGDTVDESSIERYGYYYSDIKKVISEALRTEPSYGTNKNQFVSSLSAINKKELNHYFKEIRGLRQTGLDPYKMIADLVNNGFLTLYKSKITVTVSTGDSVQYIIMPIVGTGSDALNEANIEVCPAPIFVKLKATRGGGVPLMVGGLHRDSTELSKPVEVLATEEMANNSFKLRVDSIMSNVGVKTILLNATNDPDYREGIHTLALVPDIDYPIDENDYYHKGDSIELSPAPGSYHMRQGYSYTFHIVMQDHLGNDTLDGGCAVGTIPFILSVQPDYLRWDPQSTESNEWNNPDNWIGITQLNVPIHSEARFAPMAGTYVVIPQMTDGLPYPLLPQMPLAWRDSVQKVNFEYNNCNIIRFLPGAAMGQQQRMTYNDAVVDMTMPQKKWAFRAAPVTGMISGDLYMSNADLNWQTSPWEVGSFDASGRSYKTGNASFWLSVYSRTTYHEAQNDAETEERTAEADWSKVTNGLSLSLPAAAGFAVYARTASNKDAVVRLPKNDDIYYYYTTYGEPVYDRYEGGLRAERDENAGGTAGKLAFHEESESYTISNDNSVSTEYFVFGNPTMGYIDIWGFIDDNCLVEEIGYMDESDSASIYTTVTRATAENLSLSPDVISNPQRYLPPMHAMMVKKLAPATSLSVTLNANRIVTDPGDKTARARLCGGAPAPKRHQEGEVLPQGIMKVTVTNPASPRCTSHLLLGQGYHADIRDGEDAMLTTLNIDNFSTTNTPTTPFNIYALEGRNALSIDLLDSIVNIPVSFYMSDLEYEPMTYIWFTGVNNIDGSLVFYDAQTNTERPIVDGIRIAIETPTRNHERRYYIRRPGYTPEEQPGEATGIGTCEAGQEEQVIKIIRDDQVLIMRSGHVYTMMGQKIQ